MQVSILLPYYNAELWIEETLKSIQDQSMNDWEVICVNDFSNDNSEAVVRKLANEDARIRMFSNERKGIIPALQIALKMAGGVYVTRMDADDLMTKHRLALMSDYLSLLPEKSIITGKVRYFSDGKLSEGFSRYEKWINARVEQQDHYDHQFRECVVASPNWMMRAKELIDARLFDQLVYPEDYDLVFRWYANGFKINPINEITLLWRDHPGRTSKNSTAYNQKSLFKLKIDWFCKLNPTNNSFGLLGADTKGKITAELLKNRGVSFNWYDFHYEKYTGKSKDRISDYRTIHEDKLLITIYPSDLKPLEEFLTSKGYTIGKNAWYF